MGETRQFLCFIQMREVVFWRFSVVTMWQVTSGDQTVGEVIHSGDGSAVQVKDEGLNQMSLGDEEEEIPCHWQWPYRARPKGTLPSLY